MRINQLLISVLCLLFLNVALAAEKKKKLIYKWDVNGLVYYSHLKPPISSFTRLDPHGRIVEKFSEGFDGFDEVIESAVRPDAVKDDKDKDKELTLLEAATKELAQEIDSNEAKGKLAKARKKNCNIATKNAAKVASGEAYNQDAEGNMMRVSADELAAKGAQAEKNIAFYCD